MCHLVLDTPVYNGHTTAADALWGGSHSPLLSSLDPPPPPLSPPLPRVPIVVYGNGLDMGGRVGHSIMTTLGISELIAQVPPPSSLPAVPHPPQSQEDFVSIATRLGNEPSFFRSVRSKLIHTAYEANPKNPFWDLESYAPPPPPSSLPSPSP
jgi:predicted O-linked N-acetylglucosamine transferase (SPINDLY family)